MQLIECLLAIVFGAMIIHGFLLFHDYFERRKIQKELSTQKNYIDSQHTEITEQISLINRQIIDLKDRLSAMGSRK